MDILPSATAVLPPLSYRERFRKQYEENRLRAPLDPVEDARACLTTKTLFDVAVAERLLRDAAVPTPAPPAAGGITGGPAVTWPGSMAELPPCSLR